MYYARMPNGNEIWKQKNQNYEQKCGKGQDDSETELLMYISFSLHLVWYLFLFCQKKKMQWTTCPIFFFKFLDGWILFAIFATKKDAAEIKLRERGSLYQSAARLSLEGTASGCSSSRLLPQSLYVRESLWKIASLLSKKHGSKMAIQNDTLRYRVIICNCHFLYLSGGH